MFETPHDLIVIHHNLAFPELPSHLPPKEIERRIQQHPVAQAQKVWALCDYIYRANVQSIVAGAILDVSHYVTSEAATSVFGVKISGRWRIHVSIKEGTRLLYG